MKAKPWVKEPNYLAFEHEGYHCKIQRQEAGILCGYVRLDPKHPYYNIKPDALSLAELDVHGGITYCQMCEDGFWLGFDCAHYGDLIPLLYHRGETGVYRDMDYVIKQLKSLVEQLQGVDDEKQLGT